MEEAQGLWLPYVADRIALATGDETYLYIATDSEQGLGEAARSVIVENYGLGDLRYQLSSDGEKFMKARTLSPGAVDNYLIGEKIKIYSIRLVAVAAAIFSVVATAKSPEEGGGI